MFAYIARRLCVGAVISTALLCDSAFAVLIRSGNGNTTAPADDPGFANVGKSSTGNASVTYLGNRWVLTANHVTINGPVFFDPDHDGSFTSFNVDFSTKVQIGTADLQLFRLTTDPGLPALNIATSSPVVGDPLIMVGNGLDQGTQRFWTTTGAGAGTVWTENPPPGPGNRSGFDEVGGHTLRWGQNSPNLVNLSDGATSYFKTKFDDANYTIPGFADEAQATNGDSGGGVFQKVAGQWVLAGLIFEAEDVLPNEPGSESVFGDASRIVDLAKYRSQILALAVPEPASIGLTLAGAAGLFLIARRRLGGR
jgi:hypothetical protein